MRALLVFLALGCLLSCHREQQFIYYTSSGTTITRIDINAESRFYYGKYDRFQKLPKDYIYSKYSGFDGSMGGYLVFCPNGHVDLIPATYFAKVGKIGKLHLKEIDESRLFNAWVDSIRYDYNSVIEISDLVTFEKAKNQKNNSKVVADYSGLD